jgi:hypothetical protein
MLYPLQVGLDMNRGGMERHIAEKLSELHIALGARCGVLEEEVNVPPMSQCSLNGAFMFPEWCLYVS